MKHWLRRLTNLKLLSTKSQRNHNKQQKTLIPTLTLVEDYTLQLNVRVYLTNNFFVIIHFEKGAVLKILSGLFFIKVWST